MQNDKKVKACWGDNFVMKMSPEFSSIKFFAGQGTGRAAGSEDPGGKLPQVVFNVDPAGKSIDSKKGDFFD